VSGPLALLSLTGKQDIALNCDFPHLCLEQPMNSFALYADMIRYFRRPRFVVSRKRLTPHDAVAILGLICLVFLSLIPLTLIQGLFFQLTGAGAPEPSEAFEAMNESSKFVLLAVILAPLFEELIFRSWLGFRRGVLLIMPGLLLFFAMRGLSAQPDPSGPAILCVMIACISAATYGWKWFHVSPNQVAQENLLRFVFPYVFWGTAIVFGALHYSNFASDYPIWALPIAVLPLIFAGGAIGYVRMRYGFLIGILFHGGYNALIIMISTLAMMGAA
jgi:membrane protease YdiL (CAAX protease family)